MTSCAFSCLNVAVDGHELSLNPAPQKHRVHSPLDICWVTQSEEVVEHPIFCPNRVDRESVFQDDSAIGATAVAETSPESISELLLTATSDRRLDQRSDNYEDAMQGGRVLDALRLRPEISASTMRLRRISQLYEASERLMEVARARQGGWFFERTADPETTSTDGLEEYGYRHTPDGRFEVLTQSFFAAPTDPLLAIAALKEVDLCQGYRPNVSTAMCLHEEHVSSSVWRVFQVGAFSGKPEDNIAETFSIDALAEKSNCFWVHVRAADACEKSADICECDLPSPDVGRTRHGNAFVEFRVQPLPSGGFRLTNFSSAQLSGAMKVALMVPGFMLKPMMRKKATEAATIFRSHLDKSVDLRRRVACFDEGSRGEFYQRVRSHLAGRCVSCNIPTKDDGSAFSPVASTCAGTSPRSSRFPTASSYDSAPILSDEDLFLNARDGFSTFSGDIPLAWAD